MNKKIKIMLVFLLLVAYSITTCSTILAETRSELMNTATAQASTVYAVRESASVHGTRILTGADRIELDPNAARGVTEDFSFEANGRQYQARVYLPASYDPDMVYDLMILLPGRDGDPSTWLDVYNGGGTGSQVLDTVIGDGYAYPFICVSVFCFNRIGLNSAKAMESFFEALIDAASDSYSVYSSSNSYARLHRTICGFSYSADIILNYLMCSERMLELVSQYGVFSSSSYAGYNESWIRDVDEASTDYAIQKLAVSGGEIGDTERTFMARTHAAGAAAEQSDLARTVYFWSYQANHEQGMGNAFVSLWNCAQVMCRSPLNKSLLENDMLGIAKMYTKK